MQPDSSIKKERERSYYKTEDIAEIFGVSEYTVRRWLKSGKLKGTKPGGEFGHWRISPEQYKELANQMYGGQA